MPYRMTKKNVQTRASRMGSGRVMYRRRSAYATLSRPIYRNDARSTQGITVSKSVYFEDWVASTSLLGDTSRAIVFQLSQIADFASYQQSFDQFRINYVDVTIIPKVNMNINTGGVDYSLGIVGSSIDVDASALTPTTSLAVLATKDTFKFTRATTLHKRRIYPLVQQVVAGATLGTTAFATQTSRRNRLWLDCTNASAVHAGMQVVIADSDGQTVSYDMLVRYNISFRAAQ